MTMPTDPATDRSGDRPPAPGPGRGVRVLVVTGSVGAGHDGAAHELARRLVDLGATAVVRDFLDALPAAARTLLRDAYGPVVGHAPAAFDGLFRGLEGGGALWSASNRLCALAGDAVAAWVARVRPDVVVSVYPLASQALGALADRGRLAVPFVTYLTDPAAHASWVHPAAAAHLAVTAATAEQCARDHGVATRVAGPLVPARFAAPTPPGRREELREELGLPAGRPVALLVAGSLGLGDVVDAVRDVAAAGWVPLVLCGRSTRLARRVGGVPGAVALGWREDVHELMRVADVLVHNAGGLSFTEALVAGLPAVTYRSIPGHGRLDARVLERSGLAPWPTTPRALARALEAQRLAGRRDPTWPDAARVVLSCAALPAAVARPSARGPLTRTGGRARSGSTRAPTMMGG